MWIAEPSSKDFHPSATSTDYAYADVRKADDYADVKKDDYYANVKKFDDYAPVKKEEFEEPEVKPEPVKETPPLAKNDDTPSKSLLSEADRQAIEERKAYYRNQLRQQQLQKAT